MMKALKVYVRTLIAPIDLIAMSVGWIIYLITKRTPGFAYQSLIRLFCVTRGYLNDLLSSLIMIWNRPYQLDNASGVLGNLDHQNIQKIADDIRERGYHVFKKRLPPDLCERLTNYALNAQCYIRPTDESIKAGARPVLAVYERSNVKAVRYDFPAEDLVNNPDVQALMADMSLIAVAQAYLRSRPIFDVISMWWHTAYSDKPDMEAAQYYHFDMDRPKWLKVFIYLTDVGKTNGPHTFIAGTHKSGSIPFSLLKRGYVRLTDDDIEREMHSDQLDIVEFLAPRGTIIAEDTRGLHKGKQVEEGDRLMLQFQFSNSLFGCFYPKAIIKKGNIIKDLRSVIERFPKLFISYLE